MHLEDRSNSSPRLIPWLPCIVVMSALAGVLVSGCAPTNPTMHKPDMSAIQQDHHACVVEAEKMVGFATRGRLYYYKICMHARGYED